MPTSRPPQPEVAVYLRRPHEALHLYLLIGQSNMAGRGEVAAQDRQIHPCVSALDRSCRWLPAADPIHFDKPGAGVGLGLTSGKIMAGHDPLVHVGLIPCAAGGSPISVWRPGCTWDETGSVPYDDALRRSRLAMGQGVLRGILWHQGESDSKELRIRDQRSPPPNTPASAAVCLR